MPQLFNVLKGDMSLVGPRPHAVAHDDEYGRMIANYAFRHHVKPGITGLAQVNGCRGSTMHLDQMKKRVEFDLWYIDNWNLVLDLWILVPHDIGSARAAMLYWALFGDNARHRSLPSRSDLHAGIIRTTSIAKFVVR